MNIDFGWVVDEIVRSRASESAVVAFVIFSPLDARTDGGLGAMENGATSGKWHLSVRLGSGHRPPPDIILPRIYGRLKWMDGSKVLERGHVLRTVAAPTIPARFVQSFSSKGRCPQCDAVVSRIHTVSVDLGEVEHVVRATCGRCGHTTAETTGNVVGSPLDSAGQDPARIAVYLPSVLSERTREVICRGIPYEQNLGEAKRAEHENAIFIGLPFQAMHVAQRLQLRKFEVETRHC